MTVHHWSYSARAKCSCGWEEYTPDLATAMEAGRHHERTTGHVQLEGKHLALHDAGVPLVIRYCGNRIFDPSSYPADKMCGKDARFVVRSKKDSPDLPTGFMLKTIIRASDYGTTELSIQEWRRCRAVIGPVQRIEVSKAALDRDATMIIEGREACLLLSGANAGYAGEGPHGSCRILEEAGVPPDQAQAVFESEHVTFIRDEGGWTHVRWNK